GSAVLDQIVGTPTVPLALNHDQKGLSLYFTCPSQNGGVSFEPVLFSTVMTGAGQVGGRVRVTMETNVTLGQWANAFKALIDFKTTGSVAGLGSAICAEMVMGGATMPAAGNYAPLELELVTPVGWTGVQVASFAHMQVSGNSTAMTKFEDTGYLMSIVGLGAGASKIFHTLTATPAATHGLKILIAGVAYDIFLAVTGN
ncbi:MAG TPA: hypothetical protein VMV86_02405, partial [Methanosarcinales archaeon]|nr:hypothetical protein [Methanosarcinales archaeon]